MKIEFTEKFAIPSSTPQQRKLGGGNTHPTAGLKLARASWQALMERHAPATPMKNPIILTVKLYYYHSHSIMSPKTTRPDGDNLLKIIKDAATRAGWWKDDNLVYDEHIIRHYIGDEDMVSITAKEADVD